ncbi:MAG: hypothetical protein H5U40_03680 [Polyangiaceae bacterium]|nr:hypothetical protein [Polyangiaceae bacterium]
MPVTNHDGARDGGVLIAATGLGAAVVGGSIGGMPSAGLTYVRNDGTSTASGLARARRGAAAAFDGTHLWVAGGEGEGASSLELASFGASPAVVITELEDAVRSGGVLLVSEDGREALLIGGRDEVGTLRSDSVWIHGCPSSCTAEPGPAWTRARQGAVALPSERLLVGGAGSSEVERVDFTADGPVLVARGALYVPRADPALIPIAEGIFVAVGGHDGSGPRRDSEICFP